jgi:hypothetical protein
VRWAFAFSLRSDATTTTFLECGDDHRPLDRPGLRAFCAVPILDSLAGAAGDLVAGVGDDFARDAGGSGIFGEHREIRGAVCGMRSAPKRWGADSKTSRVRLRYVKRLVQKEIGRW